MRKVQGAKIEVVKYVAEAEYRKRRRNLRMMHTVLLGSGYVAFSKSFFPVGLFRYICTVVRICCKSKSQYISEILSIDSVL